MATSDPVFTESLVRQRSAAPPGGRAGQLRVRPATIPRLAGIAITLTYACALASGAYTLFGVGRPEWGWLFNDVLFDATYFFVAASTAIAARVWPVQTRAWAAMALGVAVVVVSSVLFSLRELAPSVMDVSVIVKTISYPIFGIGLLLLIRALRGSIDREFLIDWLTLGSALVVAFAMAVGFERGTASFLHLGAPLFVVGTATLVSLGLAGIFHLGWHPPLMAVTAYLALVVLADALYAIQTRDGTYRPGYPLDQIWQVAMLLAVIAPWLPDRAHVEGPQSSSITRVVVVPLIGVVIASGLVAVVLSTSQAQSTRFIVGALLAVSVAIGVGRVLMQLRRMASRLDAATTTASHLMHELRQPLTAARLALGGLLPDAGPSQAQALREIDEQLTRISSRVTVLGPTLGSPDAAVDLRATVDRVVGELGVSAGLVVVDVPSGVLVDADEEVVATIIRNLVANALEHGRPSVRVRSATSREQRQLIVEDRGDGVAVGNAVRVFDCGESRLDDESRGVGLALAKAMARACGGDVTYAPRAGCPGRFILSLRAARR